MRKPQTCVVTGGSKGITITGTTTDSHTLLTNAGNTHLHPTHPGPPPLSHLPMQGTPTSALHTLAHLHWVSHLTYQCSEHPPPLTLTPYLPMQRTPTSTDSHTLPTNAGNTHLHWLSHLTYQCREHPPPLTLTPYLPMQGTPTTTLTPYLPMQGTPTSTLHTLAHHPNSLSQKKILSTVHWRRKAHIFVFLSNITGHLQENLYRQKIWKTTVYNCKSLGITQTHTHVKHGIFTLHLSIKTTTK